MRLRLSTALLPLFVVNTLADTVTLDKPETAGMSMFRAFWDSPVVMSETGPVKIVDNVLTNRGGTAVWKPGKAAALSFDALNRSLLVRFPDAAEKIAAELQKGFVEEVMKPKAAGFGNTVALRAGRNVLLIKCKQVRHPSNGSAFYIRIGDAVYSKPIVRGVSYLTDKGPAPVNP